MAKKTQRAWSLFVVVSSTLWLMAIFFFSHQYHNRRIKLIVICHPLVVKQLLLDSSYVFSSAVKRSCFFHGLQNAFLYEHSSMQRSPHQKCFPSVVNIMAKKGHFAVYSDDFTWYFLNGRQLEIKFPLTGRIWGTMFCSLIWVPPPLSHAVVWAL